MGPLVARLMKLFLHFYLCFTTGITFSYVAKVRVPEFWFSFINIVTLLEIWECSPSGCVLERKLQCLINNHTTCCSRWDLSWKINIFM